MPAWHCQHKRLAHQAFSGVAGFLQWRSGNAQVDTASAQRFVLLIGVHLCQIDFHLRLFEPRFGDHLWQKLIHRAADERDVHRANVALCKPACGDCRLLRALQQILRFDKKCPARRRQRNAAGAAGEQLDAEVMLQQLNLPAQRWLGHVQAFGGAAEIEFSGNRGEAAQLGEFEH